VWKGRLGEWCYAGFYDRGGKRGRWDEPRERGNDSGGDSKEYRLTRSRRQYGGLSSMKGQIITSICIVLDQRWGRKRHDMLM
jgi:hypothetical protein